MPYAHFRGFRFNLGRIQVRQRLEFSATNLDHSEIACDVNAQYGGRIGGGIIDLHCHKFGIFNDVIVRQDQAAGPRT